MLDNFLHTNTVGSTPALLIIPGAGRAVESREQFTHACASNFFMECACALYNPADASAFAVNFRSWRYLVRVETFPRNNTRKHNFHFSRASSHLHFDTRNYGHHVLLLCDTTGSVPLSCSVLSPGRPVRTN